MALQRDIVSDGLLDELERFEDLIRTLTPEEWATPSRCDGWTVGDVARHTVGTMADVVAGRLDGLGSPEVTEREVQERQGHTAAQVADECSELRKASVGLLAAIDDEAWNGPGPAGFDGSLGDGVEALWYDTFLHGDDVRSAIGRPTELGPGLAGTLSHVGFVLRKQGWTGQLPAEGPGAMEFVLTATGRRPATDEGAPPNIYAA